MLAIEGAAPVLTARITVTGVTGGLRAKSICLRERLAEKDETIGDLRRRLDDSEAERRQTQERLTALLTDQRPPKRRKWWPWE